MHEEHCFPQMGFSTSGQNNLAFQLPEIYQMRVVYLKNLAIRHRYEYSMINKHTARKEMRNKVLRNKKRKGSALYLTQDMRSLKVCPSLDASALYKVVVSWIHNLCFTKPQSDFSSNTYASFVVQNLGNICKHNKPVIMSKLLLFIIACSL